MSRARSARIASRQRPELVTETKVLGQAESGEVYIVSGSAAISLTLPSPQQGSYFKFIYGGVTTASLAMDQDMYITGAAGNIMVGSVVNVPLAEAPMQIVTANMSTNDRIITITGPAAGGDYVECVSDGTNWYVNGFVSGTVAFSAS